MARAVALRSEASECQNAPREARGVSFLRGRCLRGARQIDRRLVS
jgi:hypothetical protein